MDEPLAFAAAFRTQRGSGVVAITKNRTLLVCSLPALDPLAAMPLERALGCVLRSIAFSLSE